MCRFRGRGVRYSYRRSWFAKASKNLIRQTRNDVLGKGERGGRRSSRDGETSGVNGPRGKKVLEGGSDA